MGKEREHCLTLETGKQAPSCPSKQRKEVMAKIV